jgi:uncharacterized protein with von Willebrand factor type A (vWA) domain
MTPRLLTFIRLLREQGLPVSTAESLDALHSVSHVGLHDRALLRLSLRTTLIKSQQDFAAFDALFERFFTVPRRRKRRRGQPQQRVDGTGQRPAPQTQNGALRSPTPPPVSPPSPPTSAHQPPPQEPQPTDASGPAQAEALDVLAELEHGWQRQLTTGPVRNDATPTPVGISIDDTRLNRDFPPDHLADMYHEVERLAARLVARRALRYRRARHGRIDLRQTITQGLRSGREVPFTLIHRRRKRSKLRLIVLCDVSGSVWQVSTFLLKLVHTLQAEFSSVRSLLFVNSMVEVTDLFRHMRFPQDLDALRGYPNLNLFGFSDFGRAFYQFYRDHLHDLSRDTVIVILGDARNNAFDAQCWTLEEIRQRSQRLIWLNPEPQRMWNTGDSIMAVYAPCCDYVLECWALEHLAQAAEILLQT